MLRREKTFIILSLLSMIWWQGLKRTPICTCSLKMAIPETLSAVISNLPKLLTTFPFYTRELLIIEFPVILVLLLGVYALTTIIYNVNVLSDCVEASQEIERQVKKAKKDNKKRGIVT